jgi:hypothetical protein
MIEWIIAGLLLVWAALKERAVIVTINKLQNQWRKYFSGKNVLVFGHKQAGKTALVTYLQSGKPFNLVNGNVVQPNPTLLTAVVDKKFELQEGNWLKLKADLPGDKQLRDTWLQAIEDVKPDGVIYMIDGRLDRENLTREIDEIFEFVLNAFAERAPDPKALHIFVNFADVWADTPRKEREVLRWVQDHFENRLEGYRRMPDFTFDVAATQLSPHKTSWREADRALHRFGADLMNDRR